MPPASNGKRRRRRRRRTSSRRRSSRRRHTPMRRRRWRLSEIAAASAHQFDDAEQQYEASSLGMWVFLVTEIMFFGGLFTAYVAYRSLYPQVFGHASSHLDLTLGTINTVVLITSSLTMALAIHAAQVGDTRRLITFLVLTVLFGSTFLGIKTVEYAHKFEDGL